MLRVVLAAAIAVALLGAAMPVIEDARADRSGQIASSTLTRLSERAAGLVATEETGPGPPARRVLSIGVPDRGFATAPLDYVAIGGVPDCNTSRDTARGDVVAYRVRGGAPRIGDVPVDLRVVDGGRVRDDEDPLVLRGDARLALSLVDRDGTPTVLVGRAGSDASGADAATGGAGG